MKPPSPQPLSPEVEGEGLIGQLVSRKPNRINALSSRLQLIDELLAKLGDLGGHDLAGNSPALDYHENSPGDNSSAL